MAAFLSGAAVDCGPSSVLKNVGGRLDRDVGLHQDRLVSTANTAGPSRRVFKPVMSAQDNYAGLKEGARTASGPVSERSRAPEPFDMASLRQYLSPPPPSTAPLQRPLSQDQNWAHSFRPSTDVEAGPSRSQSTSARPAARGDWAASYDPRAQVVTASAQSITSEQTLRSNIAPWQRPLQPAPVSLAAYESAFHPHSGLYIPPMAHHPQHQLAHSSQPEYADQAVHDWPTAAEFDKHLEVARSAEPSTWDREEQRQPMQEMEEPLPNVDWRDDAPADLASILAVPPTVPELLPLRPGANQATVEPSERYAFGDQSAIIMSENAGPYALPRPKSVHFRGSSGVPSSLEEALAQSTTSVPGATASWEDPLVTDLSDFDEDAFMAFNGPQRIAKDGRIGTGDLENWGEMQKDWDEFQKGLPGASTAKRGADGHYLFQSRNPYAAEAAAREQQQTAGRESPTVKGVLELEAAVQADPTDHHAWYALGLKQQENERESAAILALAKVVQLDPDYRPAYLALAVSYTNEGEHEAANRVIAKWIDLAPDANQISAGAAGATGNWQDDQKVLVDRLIGLARMSPDEVDPDVQVALGALFNSSEQYDKAEDCFHAALAARPDDWLLYNRLGATLANSGRSSEALEYYHKALSLHPNFIRALFNMGISYINMSYYNYGAQRILEALRLQQADATEGYAAGTVGGAAKGVTSETLWHTLKSACLYLGRNDLVALATRRDLSGFPADISVIHGA